MDSSDPNVARAIHNINATKKTDPFPWTPDKPQTQAFYAHTGRTWVPQMSSPSIFTEADLAIKNLAVYTWNIDFMLPLPTQRMSRALAHLESMIFPSSSANTEPPRTPTIVLLQELLATDLDLIQRTPWIQSNFHLTDLDTRTWESGYYGTASLIDKRLPISSVFRVHYSATNMGQDGLYDATNLQHAPRIPRLLPPQRPAQLATAAKYMHPDPITQNPTPAFSLLAGDLNAIRPLDRTLHTENGLSDAYLSLGGTEDSEDGYTWGQTAATFKRERFGCSRMDKVLYCGERVEVKSLDRFGWDVVLEGDKNAEAVARLLKQGLERAWVTDHLGLRCELEVLGTNEG